MIYLFIWWLLLLIIGLAALPVTLRLLRFLPDRGYAFAKPLGLLLWIYPFWLLASFGFIQNSFGALAAILIVLALASWLTLRGRGGDSVIAWLRTHWRYVLIVEGIFLVALLAFAYFRAFNPEITATEKPMEYMFLNSIMSSTNFPPRDAWLSGYSISYYYLGYVIVASLAKLGNVPSSYAFNLGLIMTFALAAVGAFGLVFNLVNYAQRDTEKKPARPSRAAYVFGIIAIFLLLVIGNLEGVFEVGYNAGLGSQAFYASLDLHGLEQVQPSGSLIPQDTWWWWRASRVVNDINPTDGGHIEIIDEFPAFSFLLGDLHPHVLALPFGLLALALALGLFVRPMPPIENINSLAQNFFSFDLLLPVVVVGSLGMLNTWDIVTYGFVIAAAFALAQFREAGRLKPWVMISGIGYLVLLFVGGALLFLPFYLGFSSQARGIAPNIFSRTPLHQFLIMFGMFIFCIGSFLAVLFWRSPDRRHTARTIVEFAVPLLLVPVLIAVVGFFLVSRSADLQNLIAGALGVAPGEAARNVLVTYASSFGHSPWVFLLLVVLIAAIAALGLGKLTPTQDDPQPFMRSTIVFVLLLALVGLFLTFGVEFLYIRDTFENRMNTVFKLYYQSWLLLSLAATFGAYYIWQTTRGAGRAAWLTAFAGLFALSLIYPALAIPNKANNFAANPQAGTPTLDGWVWVRNQFPDDYAGIEWLRENAPLSSVILEAPGPEYSFYDRVSVATGLPTVLGWGGHELQWRGNYDEAGPREKDVDEIYTSRDLKATRDLLDKYNVSYVIVGGSEMDKYKLSQPLIDKFAKLGALVFNQGTMRIYQIGDLGVSLRTQ